MDSDWTQNTRALKVVVAVLTGLIVIGMVLLVWGMARTSKRMTDRSAAAPHSHALPPGAELVRTDLADDRVLLHLRIDGQDVLQVVDLSTGKLVRQLTLEPAR
ncbi:MAG: DUF6476 family protein [Alphaproteobacteria bacterium]